MTFRNGKPPYRYHVEIWKFSTWCVFYRTNNENDAYNRAGYLLDCENAPAGVRIFDRLKNCILFQAD